MFKNFITIISFFIAVLIIIPCSFYFFSPKTDIFQIPQNSINNTISDTIPVFNDIPSVSTIKSYILEKDMVEDINFEEYVLGVVAAEMPASFENEALMAQAIAARSYILNKLNGAPSHDNGAIVCNDPSHCKAYLTNEQLKEKWGTDYDLYYNKIKNCTQATADCVMIYDGKVIDAVFHSTSSGKTENSVDVWGKPVPYLVSVASIGDELSPKFHSSVTMSISEFKSKLQSAYSTLKWDEGDQLLGSIDRSEAGGIINIKFGNTIISGTEFRKLFSLRSTNIDFNISDTEITMNVTGNGHGVGMSQYGANYLAKQGKNFVQILKTYYSGIEVVRLNKQ